MEKHIEIQNSLKLLQCCVLVPTYNNASTIKKVIDDIKCFTDDIIVINDGSTDSTLEIISVMDGIDIVTHPVNKGKGMALRTGFKHAYSKGFKYAITIDSDGQHFANDIPLFLEKIKENQNAIIIGARNMGQAGIPRKSSFGHKFSNFWFKLETGIKAPDTQSGFRLYPLEPLQKIKFYTTKYEFEVEVIVRAAWKGVAIESVPIKVYYPPAGERVSHFRPFKDFTRISILNTVLVTMALFYYIPLRFINKYRTQDIKQLLWESITDKEKTNLEQALSVALGIFIGISPLWGYHILLTLTLAHFFKLNRILALLACNISIPPMTPLVILLSYNMGGLLVGGANSTTKEGLNWKFIEENLLQYIVGSISLATLAALVIGIISYVLLVIFRKTAK